MSLATKPDLLRFDSWLGAAGLDAAEQAYPAYDFAMDDEGLRGTALVYGDVAMFWGTAVDVAVGALEFMDEPYDPIANRMHDRGLPLARGDTLAFEDGDERLRFLMKWASDSISADTKAMVADRRLRGLSLELGVRQERYDLEADRSTILKAYVKGIAIVDRPAFPASTLDAAFGLGGGEEKFWRPKRPPRKRYFPL